MIRESELILNSDGSIFHLHLQPEQVAGNVVLVGDPGRVETVAGLFSSREFTVANREFVSVTGFYNHQRITVISTGIGTDNVDIVMNELDALVNIDLKKREIREDRRSLNIVRIGTSGGLQREIPVNSLVVSRKSIGFDSTLPFYGGYEQICDQDFGNAFIQWMKWPAKFPVPYVVNASEELLSKFDRTPFIRGVNISAPGFYAPQGRKLRLGLSYPGLNDRMEGFLHNGYRITNYEMESSAIYGLSSLMGHQALTVCLIIANRITLEANERYHPRMEKLIGEVLDILTGR